MHEYVCVAYGVCVWYVCVSICDVACETQSQSPVSTSRLDCGVLECRCSLPHSAFGVGSQDRTWVVTTAFS